MLPQVSTFFRRVPLTRPLVAVPFLFALFALTACPLEFVDLNEPTVLDVTIAPSTVHYTETGSDDNHFVIEISVANFDDEIESAGAFVQLNGGQRDAFPGDIRIDNNNVIILDQIGYTWLSNLEPGEYDIGVEVNSPTVQLIERNRERIIIQQ